MAKKSQFVVIYEKKLQICKLLQKFRFRYKLYRYLYEGATGDPDVILCLHIQHIY